MEVVVLVSETGWSVRDLAERAGTTVRTIHYYVSEGVLPPPVGATRSAVYTPAHLSRLQLIAALRDEGLSLAAIRQRLAPLTDAQVEDVVGDVEAHLQMPGDTPWTTLGLIEAALATNQAAESGTSGNVPEVENLAPGRGEAFNSSSRRPLAEEGQRFDSGGGGSASEYLSRILDRRDAKPTPSRLKPPPKPPARPRDTDRPERWYQYRVADGIELRVREDRYRESSGRWSAVVDTLRAALRRYGMSPPDHDD